MHPAATPGTRGPQDWERTLNNWQASPSGPKPRGKCPQCRRQQGKSQLASHSPHLPGQASMPAQALNPVSLGTVDRSLAAGRGEQSTSSLAIHWDPPLPPRMPTLPPSPRPQAPDFWWRSSPDGEPGAGQVLTSHIKGGLAVQCVVFAKVVHGHGTPAIDGEIHHLVKGDQLNSVELPIIDRLSTGRRRGAPPQTMSFSVAHPLLDTSPERPLVQQLFPRGPHLSGERLWPLGGLWPSPAPLGKAEKSGAGISNPTVSPSPLRSPCEWWRDAEG